ncbi:MAG: hypothetical protein R3F37_22580 [Candidatus Competibacteraceae bacterium]
MNLTIEQCKEMGRLCACHNLRCATRVLSSYYDGVFRDTGLKATQLSILAAINVMSQGEAGCSMVPLANTMSLDVSTLTRNMAVLERDGLVYRMAKTGACANFT